MNRGLKYLLRLNKNKNRQFIFDLDKTLWDYTVECAPHINGKDVLNYVHKSRRTILNAIQQDGHTLNIASRSKDPDKCKYLLKIAYPDVYFSNIQIFNTEDSKQKHIENIMGEKLNKEPFHFFDDELHLIKDIEHKNERVWGYHTPNGLNYNIFNYNKKNEQI
tara:strand:+ start:908 stop:1396 length:489 start_codon:yes stop_codon:yes gene_type:complete